jgi:uncharacterized membrane protein (UPF0127 family)
MIITNFSRNVVLAASTCIAATFWRRLRGLLGTRQFPEGQALVLKPCGSVHTFGMRYPIDVLFVSKEDRVLKTVDTMAPGRTAFCFGSSYVVELPAGTLAKTGTAAGDIVIFG